MVAPHSSENLPMAKSKNRSWIKQHVKDPYVKQSQVDGYRSRASYKLLEIVEKDRLIRSGMTVVDLGSAPGGWSQVAVRLVGHTGRVHALDLLPMDSIAGVDLVKLDTEVTDKTSKPMIVVGGPCVNPLAAEALGVTFPACGASSTIPTDKALIKLVENAFGGTNVALVVAGWEAANTRDAANILKTYDQYMTELDGKMEVQVVGTSVTAVTADPVVADPVVPDPVVA